MVLARDLYAWLRWELTVVFHDLHEEVDLGAECGSLEPDFEQNPFLLEFPAGRQGGHAEAAAGARRASG